MKENIVHIDYFIKTLSTERFDRYLGLAGGDEAYALKLYGMNAVLSESLYVPLQTLEITLRNSIHTCLQTEFGDMWFEGSRIICQGHQFRQIGEAKAKIVNEKKEILPSRIVAELPLGFWTSMFNSEYDELWKKHLFKMVPEEKRSGVHRKTFSGSLTRIRKLRNRVAHHECILKFHLEDHYNQVEFLVGIMSYNAKRWMQGHAKFKEVYKNKKIDLDLLFKEEKHGKQKQ